MSFDVTSVDGILFGFDSVTFVCENIVTKGNGRKPEADATSALYYPF